MKSLRTLKVNKSFGDLRVLKDISLTVEKGEFFGLFGPNGAGKTTLLRILTGQLPLDSGRAEVMGISCDDGVAVRAAAGIVPEAESPPTFLTTQEFLELVCRLRDVGDHEAKVDKWLRYFELEEKNGVLCRDLSKGQRQKAMLAAALIHEPEMLLLDEPFINLDPIYQRRVRTLLLEHAGKGGTVFMCTHILEIAEKLCNRVAVINKGRIVAKGSLEEIRASKDEKLEDIFLRVVQEKDEVE